MAETSCLHHTISAFHQLWFPHEHRLTIGMHPLVLFPFKAFQDNPSTLGVARPFYFGPRLLCVVDSYESTLSALTLTVNGIPRHVVVIYRNLHVD